MGMFRFSNEFLLAETLRWKFRKKATACEMVSSVPGVWGDLHAAWLKTQFALLLLQFRF